MEGMNGGKEWIEGMMDGWTKPMFVRHGEMIDGSVNDLFITAVVVDENKITN